MVDYNQILDVVQNSRPNVVLKKLYAPRDERKAAGDPEDITSITAIKLIAKRRITDADAYALFTLSATRAPTSVNGTALSDTNGEFAFLLTPAHTALAPGDYFGMIDFYLTDNFPPRERVPITYRVHPAVDNVI